MDEEYERAKQAQRDRQKEAEEHKDRVNTEKKLVKVFKYLITYINYYQKKKKIKYE